MAQVLPYLWYPLVFTLAVAAFVASLAAGLPLAAATYAPIAAAAVGVLFLEWRFPARADWRPRRSDVVADTAFMVVVQVVLPRLLALVAVFAIARWMHAHSPSMWWPHDWPLWAQVLAIVLAVDFVRYWVHRAFHTYGPLWRLHEVHHSPDILYALNVGRFHPLEKALHFACDSVPFLALGVAPQALAGYYLLYAVNGFFQHSNVRLRYGWLNYLVGSAETHRWHHARDPRQANCNFGNTTIVWDLLFRTWFLPAERPVDEIGIMNRAYPKGFWAQMHAPFRASGPSGTGSLARWLADVLVPLHLRCTGLLQGRSIARAARDPLLRQRQVLARILRANADTVFGRQHGFGGISCYEDYVAAVPVMEFEALRPFLDAEVERAEPALTREPPARYMRTSGSTARPKDIPLTPSHLEALRRIHRTSVAFQYRSCPQAFSGAILAIVSPADEGRLSNGKSFGAASGIVAASTPRLVRKKFVLPHEVLALADPRLKYLLVLRLALARRDITYFGAANSTTPLALMKLYRECQDALIADVRNGGFFLLQQVPGDLRKRLVGLLPADPRRAGELEALCAGGTQPRLADLWPTLRMVVTWTCGSAGITVSALRRELSPDTRIFELGYLASEFRGTVTLGRQPGTGLPTLDTHFFEFVERHRWDDGKPEFLTLDRLRKGVDYYILVTTPSGLYRYFINDLVRVTGFLHSTPLLKFMQKGRGVTNITGEKLYEAQVLAAVSESMERAGLGARFVMMQADEEAQGYRLYVEPDRRPTLAAARLAEEVDARLQVLNIEYEGKRASGRLASPMAAWLRPETGEAYKRHCVAQGQREGQFKSGALAYRRTFGFDLDALVETA